MDKGPPDKAYIWLWKSKTDHPKAPIMSVNLSGKYLDEVVTFLLNCANSGCQASLALYKNDRKEKETHPDYSIVCSEYWPNDRKQGNRPQPRSQATHDDVPF